MDNDENNSPEIRYTNPLHNRLLSIINHLARGISSSSIEKQQQQQQRIPNERRKRKKEKESQRISSLACTLIYRTCVALSSSSLSLCLRGQWQATIKGTIRNFSHVRRCCKAAGEEANYWLADRPTRSVALPSAFR